MKKQCRRYLLLFIFVAGGLSSVSAIAISDAEREELSRLLNEIAHLQKIHAAAYSVANRNDRIVFDYSALDADLSRIQQGIAGYLNQEQRNPRMLQPVTGDYIRYGHQ